MMKKPYLFFLFIPLLFSLKNIESTNFSACDFVEGLSSSERLECGQLEVPENHDEPNGRKIYTSYVVIKAKEATPGAHPMIYLTGGPGGGTISRGSINRWRRHPIGEKRDIILMDQRGIGHSSGLPNIHQELYEVLAKNANEEEEQVLMNEVIDQHRQKLSQKGIQLQHYNTFQNAKDFGKLMKELGYEKYNIYGGSYGTRLGRVIQDMFPEMLNAVIHNSPNPLGGDLLIERLHSYSLALSRVFKYCKNTERCRTQYPNLKEDYLKALKLLKQKPIKAEGNGGAFYVNAQDAVYILRRQLYRNNSRTKAPALIQEFLNGGGPITNQIARSDFGPGYNYPMWFSVERYEMYDPANTSKVIDKAYKKLPLLPVKLGFFDAIYQGFRDWHNETIPEEENQFKPSAVPTMIMVNQYDPVTPPKNGHALMKQLSNGHLFVLDEGGHGGGNGNCRNKVMIAFMDNPNGDVDTSCLNLYKE